MFDDNTKTIIADVATKEGFDVAALLAVCDVESAGVAFWNVNGQQMPAIRFEGNYFYARLSGTELQTAIAQGLASPTAGAIPNPNSYSGRYDLLHKAEAIDKEAADESISMGLGQVMGANYKDLGFTSATEMFNSAMTIEGQVELMVKFIKVNNLKQFLDKEDWKSFSYHYNGPAYAKNSYDTKLAAAYAEYSNNPNSTGMGLDSVVLVQRMLNAVGGYSIAVDGVLGTETEADIRDFQLKHGLVVDGVYGPLTRAALQQAYMAISNKKTTNIGITTTAASTAVAAVTETTKQISAFNSTSWVLQGICILLILVGLGITLKATLFNKTS